MACRFCLRQLKALPLSKDGGAIMQYITCAIFRLRNEGPATTCYLGIDNAELGPHLTIASQEEATKLLNPETAISRPLQATLKSVVKPPSSKPRQYVVKAFLDYRVRSGKRELLTHWASFSRDQASWIPLENASAAPDALLSFCTSRKEAGLPCPPSSHRMSPLARHLRDRRWPSRPHPWYPASL